MTNETYLVVSYICAAAGGIVVAGLTAWLFRGPLKQALAAAPAALAQAVGRLFPAWLVLTVLFAFTSVSYIDCQHPGYASVVGDRAHLENVTRQQGSTMLHWVCIALLSYAAALAIILILRPQKEDPPAAETDARTGSGAETPPAGP